MNLVSKFKNYIYKSYINYNFFIINMRFRYLLFAKKEIFFVYDNNTSPCAYGDFMNMIMLAKWCSLREISTHFIVIESNDNKFNWASFSEDAIKDFLYFQDTCLENFGMNDIIYQKYNWFDFNEMCSIKNIKHYVAFGAQVFNKEMVINYCFNILNELTKNASKGIINKWVLNKTDFKKLFDYAKLDKYIAWNIRRTFVSSGAVSANNTEEQILRIYPILRSNFPKYKIVIVSDLIGTEFVKDIRANHNLDIVLSNELFQNNSYLSDSGLVLNCHFYFQFSGGGMSTIPLFSNLNYLIFQKPGYEERSLRNGKLSWANAKQVLIPLDKYSPDVEKYIPDLSNLLKHEFSTLS